VRQQLDLVGDAVAGQSPAVDELVDVRHGDAQDLRGADR
jgi:hypothetical protein